MNIERWRIPLSRMFVVLIAFLFLSSTQSWRQGGMFDLTAELTGLVLITIGTYGRIWSYLFICGRKTDQLVTVGPYSLTRNPLYLSSLIGAVGLGLASENVAVLLAVLVAYAAVYPLVIRAEERKLARLHGDAFARYAAVVPRFLPRTLRVHEPETYEVHSRKFRRVFFDTMWFVWLFVIMKIIEKLQQAEILPVLYDPL